MKGASVMATLTVLKFETAIGAEKHLK